MNLARSSGALSDADYNNIQAKLDPTNPNRATSWSDIYSILSGPQASVVLNNLGIQVGEDVDPTTALAEVSQRESAINRALSDLGLVGGTPSTGQIAAAAKRHSRSQDSAL